MASIDATLNLNTVVNGTEAARAELSSLTNTLTLSAADWQRAGLMLTGFGVAGAYAIKNVLDAAIEFEKQMSVVKAITQTTGEEFKALEDRAISLGASTAFTAEEVAQGMQYLGQAGFTTNEILESISATLTLAIAGQADLGRASDITASVLRAFNIDASETGRVVDVISKTIVSSNTDLEGYAESMKYFAPIAKVMGISIEEASAAIGIFGNSGEKGSIATRAFGTSLTRLAKPSEAMEDTLSALNLLWGDTVIAGSKSTKFFDEQTGTFIGLADTIGLLTTSMEGLTQEQQLNAISSIFGADALQEVLMLMQAGPEAIDAYTASLKDSAGYADALAKIQMDNLYGSLELLSGAFDSLKITLGTAMIPIFRALADAITWVVDKLNASPPIITKLIAVGMLLITTFLLVAGAISLIMGLIPAFTVMFTAVATIVTAVSTAFTVMWIAITGPIGLVVTAIASIIAVIALLVHNWDWVVEKMRAGWEWLKVLFNTGVDAILYVWGLLPGPIRTIITLVYEIIVGLFTIMFESLKFIFNLGVSAIKFVWETGMNFLKSVAELAWAGILYVVDLHVKAVMFIIEGISAVLDWLGLDLGTAKDNFVEFASTIESIVTPVLEAITDALGFMLDKITAVVKALKTLNNSGGVSSVNTMSNTWGGARAAGGPVTSGKDYLVGENGPEIFSPGMSGNIIPNGGLSSGTVINNYLSIEGVFSEEVAERILDYGVRKLSRSSAF